jgi:hypothetical protein
MNEFVKIGNTYKVGFWQRIAGNYQQIGGKGKPTGCQ